MVHSNYVLSIIFLTFTCITFALLLLIIDPAEEGLVRDNKLGQTSLVYSVDIISNNKINTNKINNKENLTNTYFGQTEKRTCATL